MAPSILKRSVLPRPCRIASNRLVTGASQHCNLGSTLSGICVVLPSNELAGYLLIRIRVTTCSPRERAI